MKVKKIIKVVFNTDAIFKTSVFAYKVYRLVPKFDKIQGIDCEKLIASVNEKTKCTEE